MARLTAKERRKLKSSQFVYPKSRSYPVHTENHAKAALFLAAQKRTKGNLATVKRAVKKRFPKLVKKG